MGYFYSSTLRVSSQPSLFLTRVQVADRDKHPSFLQPGLNYRDKKFFFSIDPTRNKRQNKKMTKNKGGRRFPEYITTKGQL